MKKTFFSLKTLFTAIFIFAGHICFSQTTADTVKTGTTNDPMVINPGTGSDSMTVKPENTNDEMAVLADTGFISKNITDNLMEIKLAKSAQSKGKSPQVKKMAALLVKDHTIMLNDLKKLAVKKGISSENYMNTLPSEPVHANSGTDFDKEWASLMLTMHEEKITELESYISQSTDKDIKAAASRALPKIKLHRDMLLKISGAKSKTGIA